MLRAVADGFMPVQRNFRERTRLMTTPQILRHALKAAWERPYPSWQYFGAYAENGEVLAVDKHQVTGSAGNFSG